MPERDYLRDGVLLQALQDLPGVKVGFVRSTKRTAVLLRQAFAAQMETVTPAFFGGWLRTEAGDHRFYQLSPSTTHSDGVRMGTLTEAIGHPSPAVAATAAKQFWHVLKAVREPMTRWLLTVWFHASALTTLLEQFGYPLPLALCIFAADASWQDYLCGLFRWLDDAVLSLDLPPAVFSQGLLCRKDEPLVVLDQHRTANAAANASLLEQVLVNGQILWKSGRESSYFPLQALPVILTSAASALSCAPETIVLELAPDGLDPSAASAKSAEPLNLSHDYLRSFIGFAADHIERLRDILERSAPHACQSAGDRLTEKCARAFGVLLGVSSFLQEFLRCCGLTLSDFTGVEDEWESWLLALLEQTSEKELDYTDLADQFIAVARSHLLSGALHACPTEYRTLPEGDIVFFDDRSLYFTPNAFRQVCHQLSQSRPMVLQALRQAGFLQGRPVNATTGLTRVSIWNAFGVRETRQVYKLPREAFDQLGEPLIFAEEAEA